ncbi:MAG: squalene/phytoene synthase family protein [Amylibacter sp.]|nr:squalene/phytoene synthase family protein [Amylibacter sp.]
MSIEACAELVERGDPDRFLSAMTAAPDDRGGLMVLYAFNLEVVRAPWVTKEAMIAEMRLQWWADAIEEIYAGGAVRKHEVVTPLAALIADKGLDRAAFDALIEARRWDIYKEPHESQAAFDQYISDTSAGLMWLAAQALGAAQEQRSAVIDFGYGAGVAALFRAIPALENAQKYPLVDGSIDGVSSLAQKALVRLQSAKGIPRSARAALRAGWMAEYTLRIAAQSPKLVAAGGLGASEFSKKIKLLWMSLTGGF